MKRIYIIGGPILLDHSVKYRRRYILECLLRNTEYQIRWVFFENRGINEFGKHVEFPIPEEYKDYSSRLKQIAIFDYKYLIARSSFIQRILLKKMGDVIDITGNILWYTLPRFHELSMLKGWGKIIYDCSDSWVDQFDGNQYDNKSFSIFLDLIKKKYTLKAESFIVNNSSYIFSSSEGVREYIYSYYKKKSITIEHGVDLTIQKENKKIDIPWESFKYTAGFVGSVSSKKLDFELMLDCALISKDIMYVYVGCLEFSQCEKPNVNSLLNQENVFFVEQMSPSEVLNIIPKFNVGFFPYKNNRFNKGVFPIKFYQFYQNKVPIVSVGLPSLNGKQLSGGLECVDPDPKKIINSLVNLAEKPNDRLQEIAQENKWEDKINEIIEIVGLND
jgi:teichuronic acid biosynthesis glycosyltransferase TuaH